MSRLNIIVEGQTEETFVNNVLAPHLGQVGIFAAARKVETGRSGVKIYRGGLSRTGGYARLKKDILLWAKQDNNQDVYFTTMIDLYALPADFPEQAMWPALPVYERTQKLEGAFGKDINHQRFIPYIQVHEFESLLFSDPQQFDWEFIDQPVAIQRLWGVLEQFGNPEFINDGVETAPSKRIIEVLPQYERRKSSAGPVIAAKIGLSSLREKCPHFNEWVGKLEKLK